MKHHAVPQLGEIADVTDSYRFDRHGGPDDRPRRPANARPIRLDMPGKSGTESLTFSEYNQIKEPKAPPAAQLIDGKTLGM